MTYPASGLDAVSVALHGAGMRLCGELGSGRGLGPHDHACWAYAAPDRFLDPALEFLEDGLHLGLRVMLVASLEEEELWAAFASLGDVEALRRDGRIGVGSLSATYVPGEVIDGPAQVARYLHGTDAALAAGHTGYRVAADATQLVRTEEQRAAFVRYEQLVDRAMARRPFSALCAYDRALLGEDAVAELASAHPLARPGCSPLGLFHDAQERLALRGELELFELPLCEQVVLRAVLPGATTDIDARHVGFVDHSALCMMDRVARAVDARIVLHGAGSGAVRLAGLLDLASVEVRGRG